MFVFFVSCPCERSGLAGIGFQFAVSHGRLLFVLFDEFLANEREGRKRKRSVCFGLLVAHAVHTCTLALNHTQTSTRARKAGGTWTRARLSSVLFYVCVSLADVLCAPSGFPSHVARRCVIEVGGGGDAGTYFLASPAPPSVGPVPPHCVEMGEGMLMLADLRFICCTSRHADARAQLHTNVSFSRLGRMERERRRRRKRKGVLGRKGV